jgi:multimeric flavodoxin WrbA
MDTSLKVLVLNGSLKHGPNISNTEEVAQMLLAEMQALTPIMSEIIRLSDKRIPVGLGFKESDDDEWPDIVKKIMDADIVIFATPIWWGAQSSLIQRVIERMDAFDEEFIHGGSAVLLNKVAGIVITGSEDGAQAVMSRIMSTLSFLNFTLPPQCCTYWVGEVGTNAESERDRRLKNPAVLAMAQETAKGLTYFAKLLKDHPIPGIK